MLFSNKPQMVSQFRLIIFVRIFFIFIFLLIINIQANAKEVSDLSSNSDNTYEKLKIFSEVLSLIESSYVEKVDSKTLIEGAIAGLVKTLDPHTTYMPPEAYKEMQVQTSGKFGGLGIEVGMEAGVVKVNGKVISQLGLLTKNYASDNGEYHIQKKC